MIVSKPAIVLHVLQIVFNFLAMCCFASVASFQAKWHVGPCVFFYLVLGNKIVSLMLRAAFDSWPFRICALHLYCWDTYFCCHASHSRRIREIRQICPSGSRFSRSTRRVHLDRNWCHVQSSRSVSVLCTESMLSYHLSPTVLL